jgi:hypothetical protein
MTDPLTRKRAYLILAAVLAVFFTVKGFLVVRSRARRDYSRWHDVARLALSGEPLADLRGAEATGLPDRAGRQTFYKLPPAFAVYAAPLGRLDYVHYVLVYYLINVLATVVAVFLAVRLLTGRWLPGNPWPMVIAVAFILPAVHDDLHCGNNNLIILVLMLAAAWLAARRWLLVGGPPLGPEDQPPPPMPERPSRARQVAAVALNAAGGLALGLAVSLKAFPAAMVAILPLMRRWKLAVWSLVGIVVWTLLVPGVLRGFQPTWRDTWAWGERIIFPYFRGGEKVQWDEKGVSIRNISLWGQVHRFTRPVDALDAVIRDPEDPRRLYVNVVSVSPKTASLIFLAVLAGIAAAIAAVCLRRPPPGRLPAAVDLSIAMLFVLLATPIAWMYFYSLLLLPALTLAALMWEHYMKPMGWLAAIALIDAALLMVASALPAVQALGGPMWVALGWLIVLLVVRGKMPRPARPAAESEPLLAPAPQELSAPQPVLPEPEHETALPRPENRPS